MSPLPKRRFNAFEDYRNDPASTQERVGPSENEKSTLQPIGEEEFQPIERIERLKPSQMMPDRFQPRRLLPTALRNNFYNRKVDCYQTAQKWIDLAKGNPAYELQVNQLLAMGESFLEHGQIKPITGNWGTDPKGGYIFYIETGERRFWAACLNYIKENRAEEPQLRVEVVVAPSRYRQVLENRHSETPSAVGQACEIASIILTELNIHPKTDEFNEFNYFRQVHSHRMPRGLWDKLSSLMQLSRPRMEQLLGILAFSDAILETADRYRLPERLLREILALPSSQWNEALALSIKENLNSEDLIKRLSQVKQEKQDLSHNVISDTNNLIKSRNWNGFSQILQVYEVQDSQKREQILENLAQKIAETKKTTAVVEFLEKLLYVLKK